MKKSEPVGTKVKTVHGDEGTILQNRKTMPDLKSSFDYVVEICFNNEETVEWGFAAKELTLASVK